ncbi:hypothetical protein MmTuc01_0467 [Methanosarcina mazei Tuc01]|uniref:DUF2795 domain-containing protein n=1 Tax=Methanosarcina mazei Tuc01 TaxID=1236903 RepID=M1PUM5_METMZ|nr:DUF2795 domain-containing protein [Methanosarcina mazei]AGF95901.1 hypothetical protein MmTuc01_0467 [Methanosarcina mazei Tuc01]
METESKDLFITELPVKTQEILKNMDYPVKRNEIIGRASRSGAIPDVMRELGMLPDRKYYSEEDVAEELHKIYMGIPA